MVFVYHLWCGIYSVNLEACGEDQSPGGAATIVRSMQTESPGRAAMIVRSLQPEEPKWGCINISLEQAQVSEAGDSS